MGGKAQCRRSLSRRSTKYRSTPAALTDSTYLCLPLKYGGAVGGPFKSVQAGGCLPTRTLNSKLCDVLLPFFVAKSQYWYTYSVFSFLNTEFVLPSLVGFKRPIVWPSHKLSIPYAHTENHIDALPFKLLVYCAAVYRNGNITYTSKSGALWFSQNLLATDG